MIVYLYKHRPNEEKKENLDYKLIPPLSPQALLPHGRLSCLEVLTRRYFFFLPYVYEKKINKNFPLKLNFALSVFPSNRAPFFRGQLPDDLFYFFKFFLPPGFNLLAKEKKAKKKSNFFLKKLQGNEDFFLCKSSAKDVSFKWEHYRISSTD